VREEVAPLLVCENVSFSYARGPLANREIAFELRPGELLCLLGSNGAGKTTLLRQIYGELRPSSGKMLFLGEDLRSAPKAIRRMMGVLPQGAGLFRNLSVFDHVRYFALVKGIRDAAAEANRVLEEVALREISRTPASQLSGGQQRRLLLAIALLGTPKLLILDEPTVGLDAVARRSLWDTLRKLKQGGCGVILTTHYLDEAEQLADRICFLQAGQILRSGTLAELFREIGATIRVTEYDPANGETTRQSYFDTIAEAQKFAAGERLVSYSVSRVSLEDVYIRVLHGEPNQVNSGTI
jgi:ABC-type multidrug transport system ATPase subunit